MVSRAGRSCCGAALVLALLARASGGADVEIAPDGMLVVDGRRMFVVGLYHAPRDAGMLRDAAVSGFNVVRAGGRDSSGLDRLWTRGLYGWVQLPLVEGGSEPPAADGGAVAALVARMKNHPAMLLWDQRDEALWDCWWPTLKWRRTEEPAEQRSRIVALADVGAKLRLTAERERADELLRAGEFAAAEKAADFVWSELGERPREPRRSLADVPACVAERARALQSTFEAAKAGDPCHPVWINHAPRNRRSDLAAYNEASDIVGCDIYPVPEPASGHSDLPDQSLAAVGAYTDLMAAAAGGRPVFMVLQAFGWGELEARAGVLRTVDKPPPSHDEMRFMAYDAIVHGARGVFFYGSGLYGRGSQPWGDLCLLGTELLELREVLAAPDAPTQPEVRLSPTWTSEGRGVMVLAKRVDAATWYLVVNENRDPLRYSLCGLEEADGTSLEEHRAGLAAVVSGGCVSSAIRGFGAQVLGRTPTPESGEIECPTAERQPR